MRVLELSCSNGLAGQDLSTTDGQPEAPGDGPRLHLPADCHGLARYCRGTATPTTRLYNVRADPREQSDLAAAVPELVAEMRARLDAVELVCDMQIEAYTASVAKSTWRSDMVR